MIIKVYTAKIEIKCKEILQNLIAKIFLGISSFLFLPKTLFYFHFI